MILTCIYTYSKSCERTSARAILFPCPNLCMNPWPARRASFDWKSEKVRVSRVSRLCCKPNIVFRMLGKAIKHPLTNMRSLPAGCPQKRGMRDQASRQWQGRLRTKAQTYITSQMQNGWPWNGVDIAYLVALCIPEWCSKINMTNRICSQLAPADGHAHKLHKSWQVRSWCSAYISLDLALAWHSESTFGGWPSGTSQDAQGLESWGNSVLPRNPCPRTQQDQVGRHCFGATWFDGRTCIFKA